MTWEIHTSGALCCTSTSSLYHNSIFPKITVILIEFVLFYSIVICCVPLPVREYQIAISCDHLNVLMWLTSLEHSRLRAHYHSSGSRPLQTLIHCMISPVASANF
ncbi:uncharacterized protein LOC143204493 [Rhynchophorus ferrugineus]|uniref:uncharacterized protein LOC143204493 n=1 Tax=Rhynchophorus ferrugineus TaxID=354439 RepID=UPI003FCC52A9